MVLTRILEKARTHQFLTIFSFEVFGWFLDVLCCSKNNPLSCASWVTVFDFFMFLVIYWSFVNRNGCEPEPDCVRTEPNRIVAILPSPVNDLYFSISCNLSRSPVNYLYSSISVKQQKNKENKMLHYSSPIHKCS